MTATASESQHAYDVVEDGTHRGRARTAGLRDSTSVAVPGPHRASVLLTLQNDPREKT
jgi:hypothetical protein